MTPVSHRISVDGEKVTIHDLELFVGYDPSLDGDDEKIRKFDAKRITEIVERTREHMKRGQNPKLILGHNPSTKDGDRDPRPTLGDIPVIAEKMIAGVPGIVGDVMMDRSVFDTYLKSNSYPRRSAEIWPDGFLSEVALLGSQTPARPLPDTKFAKVECFSRTLPEVFFGDPGPHNVNPPRGDNKMADDKDPRDDEMSKLKARNAELEEEVEKMKAQMACDDKKEPMKNARVYEMERDDMARQLAEVQKSNNEVRSRLFAEKYGRVVEQMAHEGYRMTPTVKAAITQELTDISMDPKLGGEDGADRKVKMYREVLHKDPLRTEIDQKFARSGHAGGADQFEREDAAANRARDRVVAEKLPSSEAAAKFRLYLQEEREKAGLDVLAKA